MPNIRLVTFAGETVTPIDDALVYQTAIADSGIIYGASVTQSDASTLHISAGYGIASGRFFEIFDTDIIVQLSSSGNLLGQLYVHMDLGSALSPIEILYETGASLTPMRQDTNVNVSNGVYEFQLATFKVNTSTISNLAYTAPIVSGGGSGMIGKAENSNRASKAYKVNEFMIWNNSLWKVRTAIAKNGTITTNKLIATTVVEQLNGLGGFRFGYTADNRPGYIEPGADTVNPFSTGGIDVLGSATGTFSQNLPFAIASGVDLSEYAWIGVYEEAQRGVHPYANIQVAIGNANFYIAHYHDMNGIDPRNDDDPKFSLFIPVSGRTDTVTITATNLSGDYPPPTGTVTVYGIKGE